MHYKTVGKSIRVSDGAEIYYEIDLPKTKYPYIVFLHGLGADLTAWDNERKGLRHLGFPTLAIDLRGHGLSSRPRKEDSYHMYHFALDLRKILQKEHLSHTVITGHCFGGMVSLVAATLFPKSMDALILVDTNYKPPYFGTAISHNHFMRAFSSFLGKHTPTLKHAPSHSYYSQFVGTWDYNPKRVISDMLHTSLKSYFYSLESVLGFDAETLLKKIHIPTLIIEGTKDIVFPPSTAKNLAHRIKTSHLEFIPDANHIIVLNNPKELVKTIHTFLKTLYSTSFSQTLPNI